MTDMRKNKKIYTEISNLYVNMFSDIFDEYMSGENIGVNKAKEAEFFRRYRKIKRNEKLTCKGGQAYVEED